MHMNKHILHFTCIFAIAAKIYTKSDLRLINGFVVIRLF